MRRVLDARIAEGAAQLLGIEELYLLGDSLYWKAPLRSTEQGVVSWHQDRQYWSFSSRNDMNTACICLYHADDRSGGLRFAVGSYRWGLVGGTDLLSGEDNTGHHGRPPIPAGAEWIEVCPKLEPGQVTFHPVSHFMARGQISALTRAALSPYTWSQDQVGCFVRSMKLDMMGSQLVMLSEVHTFPDCSPVKIRQA